MLVHMAPSPTNAPLRIAVMISGAGSTLANLIQRIERGTLRGARIVQVISSRGAVRGVEIARQAGLTPVVIRRRAFAGIEPFSDAIAQALDSAGADLVVMAGYLCLWKIPPRYAGRVINIHPALLPRHGGQGMHGDHVHAAVLAAGDAESGCTVHLADDAYDHGAILAQRRVPVLAGDTPATLGARVRAVEAELYPEVIAEIAARGIDWLRAQSSRE